MEVKKKSKVNLEKFKLMFWSFSAIISVVLLIGAFDVYETGIGDDSFQSEVAVEEEEMTEITRQDEKVKEPEPVVQKQEKQQQQIVEVIKIVDNSQEVEDPGIKIDDFDESENIDLEPDPEPEVEDKIFVYVKNMPEFPGGNTALRRWVGKNIIYPAQARENGIEGTVYLRFEVTKSGKVGKVELQKGADPLLDEEAIRVIKKLPKFKPGEQNGKKVNVWYSIPVTFKLS
ncbi:MAG: hypothetical protein CSB06_00275 [Bacteroidia bacterium]|nr:MAG: hypothetical protein CSB06_00275 [Bacteroidia bacterium]